jgi:hypothetical protein
MFPQVSSDGEAGRALRVTFNSPQSGFMSLGLAAGGREFVAAVAARPRDSLRELIAALRSFAAGARGPASVRWNCEPGELDFRFTPEGEGARFEVVRYAVRAGGGAAGEVVFGAGGGRAEICRAFLRALEDLRGDAETDEFASNWRREFPVEELRELARALDSRATDAGEPRD